MGLTVWHRAYFDSRLRWLPDLVAGFFSDDHAIRFCDTEDWRYDLLVPVISNRPARHTLVQRWLARRREGKVFVPPELDKQFREAFSRLSTLLIRGVPESGKTTTTLEIATRLLDQQRGLRHRIYYYAQLSDGVTVEALVQAIQRRRSLPSLFIFDDCHVGFDVAERVVERLNPELIGRDPRMAILLLTRHIPTPGEDGALEDSDRIADLKAHGAIVELSPGIKPMQQVMEHPRPDLKYLSKTRVERIYQIPGGDLFLLDEVLEAI